MKLSASAASGEKFWSLSKATTSGIASVARAPRIAVALSAALRRAGVEAESCRTRRISGSAAVPRCSSSVVAASTSFGARLCRSSSQRSSSRGATTLTGPAFPAR